MSFSIITRMKLILFFVLFVCFIVVVCIFKFLASICFLDLGNVNIEGLEYMLIERVTRCTINTVLPYVSVWLIEELYVKWFLFPI